MSVEERLAGLATRTGPDLEERVFAGWMTAPSRLGEVHVAVTGAGVQYVRGADGTSAEEFAESYRERFGRPVRRLSTAPRGLLPALRGAKGSGPRLDTGELSEFERSVLDVTARIPAGQVRPYGWVAREAGRPSAVRAAASVLARNPVPLLVPCHRVVRGTGVLGDYMYGAERKRELLRDEGLDVDGADAATARGELFVASDTTGVVCFPSCHHARRITAPHRRPFRRVDAAQAAGFRPCRDCRPAAVA